MNMTMRIVKVAWPVVESLVRMVVPPLSEAGHKGTMGRIGVIGGSADYSGAPYYAAVSALKMGADLSWVYCSEKGSIPIKSYSPELMATPFYSEDSLFPLADGSSELQQKIQECVSKVVDSFPRMHGLVIGPGLGRDPKVHKIVGKIIQEARKKELPLVIDGDGLFLVENYLHTVIGYDKCILTPNHREFERLTDAAVAYCEEQLSAMADPTQLDTTPWDGSATHAVAYFEALIERLQGDRDQQGGEDQSQQNQQVGQQGQLGHQQHQQHQHESFLPPHVQQQHASSPRVQQTEGAQHGDSSAGLKAQEIAQAQRVHALSTALGGVTILMKGAVDTIAASRCVGRPRQRPPRSRASSASSSPRAGVKSGTTGATDQQGAASEQGRSEGQGVGQGEGEVEEVVYVVEARGAPRRCGGLGDILSGTTATALHWALQRKDKLRSLSALPIADSHSARVNPDANTGTGGTTTVATAAASATGVDQDSDSDDSTRNATMQACMLATILSKQAAELAFAAQGRSMTAPDVVTHIGQAFRTLYPEG